MAEQAAPYSKSFDENIDSLFEELKLAIQWNRPSILLAVHKSIPSRAKAEAALHAMITKLGQAVVRVEATHESPDVARTILQATDRDKSVFFVSNIDRGGGEDGKDAYRALNIYRELFVEQRVRAVFWLTVNEALALPHHAPDFWAFRHRVIEFATPRAPKTISLPAGLLIWHIQAASDAPNKLREKIASRERLLKELPARAESLSTRIELLYTLGYLHWALGEIQKSRHALNTGVELAQRPELSRIQSWLLNGSAILEYEAGDRQKALKSLAGLSAGNPQDNLIAMNYGTALCAVGKNSEAIAQGKKAIRSEPTNARLWNTLGFMYAAMGMLDESARCFVKAKELAPSNRFYYESLAACYNMMGLQQEALEQLKLAAELTGSRPFLMEVFEQAVLGEDEKALSLLRAAVESGRFTRDEVRRDPNLNILFDEALSKAFA